MTVTVKVVRADLLVSQHDIDALNYFFKGRMKVTV